MQEKVKGTDREPAASTGGDPAAGEGPTTADHSACAIRRAAVVDQPSIHSPRRLYESMLAATKSRPTPCATEESDTESIEYVNPAEKVKDPLRGAQIRRVVDGTCFIGYAIDIEQGKVTKERLYFIRYQDNDCEHLTAEQVEELRVYPDGENEHTAAFPLDMRHARWTTPSNIIPRREPYNQASDAFVEFVRITVFASHISMCVRPFVCACSLCVRWCVRLCVRVFLRAFLRACVCAFVRACVCACVRLCERALVRACA